MTGWNYRVVKTLPTKGLCVSYAVHEVHYGDDDLPAMVTVHDVSPAGETVAEFIKSRELWMRAFEKPVLIFDDKTKRFVGEEPPMTTPEQCPTCGRVMDLVCWICEESE